MVSLRTTAGADSYATAVNAGGQVAGYFIAASGVAHAFITGAKGVGMTDLGTLGGPSSEAFGVNANGQVVGQSQTASGAYHAFIADAGGQDMTDLGTLGGTTSYATAINDRGQATGMSTTASGELHAFVTGTDGRGMTDLNALVALKGGDYLTATAAINGSGQLIAYSHAARTYLLTPRLAPSPQANGAARRHGVAQHVLEDHLEVVDRFE